MGYTVRHRKYGSGKVEEIENGYIRISFDEGMKKFQFPKAFEGFLQTDDLDLLEQIKNARDEEAREIEEKKQSISPVTESPVRNTNNASGRSSYVSFERNVSNSLVGDRAQSIPVSSEEEMFEIVGYMASPGRISSFEAEVPKDGRDEIFESMFPGQTYRPIEMAYTPSGMPNKLSPQFRINFSDTRNCPPVLKNNMGKGNGSCAARINKSKFVIEMVQNYGFRFGDWQNVTEIRGIAEKRGYLEAFERGYAR